MLPITYINVRIEYAIPSANRSSFRFVIRNAADKNTTTTHDADNVIFFLMMNAIPATVIDNDMITKGSDSEIMPAMLRMQ